jgi:hypothetical protein
MQKPPNWSISANTALISAKNASENRLSFVFASNQTNILPLVTQTLPLGPFVGGFYVAALVKAGRLDEAQQQLEKLAALNRLGVEEEWEFNEWCHGRSGRPMGYPHQAWSAGMYIFAYHCVRESLVTILVTAR